MNVDTNEIIHVWKEPLCHAHCNFDRSLWCADENPYLWDDKPCKVMFFHRKSGKVIDIFSEMPKPQYPRDGWHIDPHPQFTVDGEYIVSTTTVREGLVDLAITPVTPILEANGLEK